jgi:hypothetical protein
MRPINWYSFQWGAIQVQRVRGKCETVLVLYHFDWGGTDERLKAHDEAWKKACEKTEGAEYLGRYNPYNKKYHWTAVTKVKDLPTWYEVTKKFEWKRDLKATTHDELELYSGPQ